MVIDTSAVLAVLFNEPERADFVAAIAQAPRRSLSAASYVEAAIVADNNADPRFGEALDAILMQLSVEVAPVTVFQARLAREAYKRFGKGRHRASLNYGDCFSYALAKASGEPLLFKGNDFGETDVGAVI